MKDVYQDHVDIGLNPYKNKASNHALQEFHYSGSFGIPGTFQN